jgi:hypothetical protein
MQARPLPPRPNLEQYKDQAKELLRACTSADPHAIPAWTRQWFAAYADQSAETEAREEMNRIEKSIRASKLAEPDAKLADAQNLFSGF